jgi:hypothetical protein
VLGDCAVDSMLGFMWLDSIAMAVLVGHMFSFVYFLPGLKIMKLMI